MARKKIGKGIRRSIAVRYAVAPTGDRLSVQCHYCGVVGWMQWVGPVPYDSIRSSLEFDHVVPLNRGGEHSERNIVLACYSCNASKCDRTINQWLDVLRSKRSRHPRRLDVLARMTGRAA